jgi:hypothetical protein
VSDRTLRILLAVVVTLHEIALAVYGLRRF